MYENDRASISILGISKRNSQRSGFLHLFTGSGLLTLFILISLLSSPSVHGAGIQPTDVLQNGYVLFSCFATAGSEPALAIMDLSPAGGLYDGTGNPSDLELDVSGSFSTKTSMWKLSDFGGSQIMGTTFDNRDGTIYVSTSGLYRESEVLPRSEVWQIAPNGGAPTLIATLPGSQGTGWIDYDEGHNQLYASNLDDGLIYIVDPSLGTGQIITSNATNSFAPHAADDINEDTTADEFLLGLPPLGQRIWGVGYNEVEERLYYAVWVRDDTGTGSNIIRSISINPDGTFNVGSDNLEITQTINTYGQPARSGELYNMPVSDIVFSQDGTIMLLAEQSFDSLVSITSPRGKAHMSRVLEYRGSSSSWTLSNSDDAKHKIGGTSDSESNSRGSVSFTYHSIDGTGLMLDHEAFIAAGGDALIYDDKRATGPNGDGDAKYFVYGIQYHPITGGSQNNSIKIDLNGENTRDISDKNLYGDIDVRMERRDYGDLPDIYVTTGVNTGASHVLDSITFLGAGVDPEGNGQPNVEADGDDTDLDGTHVSDLPDDEDGITFLDPFVPGETARIQVIAGSDGFLNAFIDFDNDGTLDSVTINAASATGSAGTLADLSLSAGTHVITIDIPATTTGAQIYSRFRFTADAGDPAAATPVGTAATGEVEDYVLMSIGNRVWLDNGVGGNADNGQFDANEQAVSNVEVKLYDGTNTLIATTTTDADGYYLFTGLNPDDYTVEIAPTNFGNGGPLEDYLSTTGADNGDTLDSTSASSDNGIDDANPAANGIRSNVITLALDDEPTGEEISGGTDSTTNSNLTVDFGFVQHDWGDLPDGNATDSPSYNTLDDGTPGASHAIVPGLYMGTAVDQEPDGQPSPAADGDNSAGSTPNDEAGITLPAFTPGATVAVNATVVNTTGVAATLYGFIDFNGDGDFGDTGETVSAPANSSGTVPLTFNVPANADTTQLLGARFRLSTDGALGPDGPAPDGEVEDYLIATLREEYGDLPDIYGTINGGTVAIPAVHVITDTLSLGVIIDSDGDGTATVGADGDDNDGTDDEDGITFLTPIMPGEPVNIQVDATISGPSGTATVGAWIDLNGDGDFADTDEYHTLTLTSGAATGNINFTAPATVSEEIYSRFRIAYDATEVGDVTKHVGSASSGEVEDYVLMSLGNRVWLDNGPGTANNGAFDSNEAGIGGVLVQLLDASNNVIAETTTAADGTYLFTGLPEDTYVVHLPDSNFGTGAPLEHMASSTDSGTTGNVDPDTDTDDESADENGIDDADPATNGISSQPISLELGMEPTADGNGVNSNLTVDFGFVEYDWGDLPDGTVNGSPSYNTLEANTGPSHVIVPGLFMGNLVDAETDGQPDTLAAGDDGAGIPDDEDGVTFPAFYTGKDATVDVTVTNTGTAPATLYGFIDFNGDGDFGDTGETQTAVVNPGDTAETLTFSVPATADTEQLLGARFRLSTDGAAASADGPAKDGEIEDYLISVFGLEYGDLPDTYGTISNGTVMTPAVHIVTDTLKLGSVIDSDTNGSASVGADGDDVVDNRDDEDGITFLTPIVAGQSFDVQVSAYITGGPGREATVGAWIDLDGDGTFIASEYQNVTLTGGTGMVTTTLTFVAPNTVSDTIYSRFRIAYDADEVDDVTDHVGSAATGEVEDYVLMSLGDLVWIDDGAGSGTADNGIVDGNESTQGVEDVVLQLMDDAGNPVDGDLSTAAIEPITTTTDINGEYAFTGLISDTYQVKILPDNFVNDGALVGYGSSAPETPGTDDRDNGIDPATLADYLTDGVSSDDVDLFNGQAPAVGVDGNGENSDFTVDFGFVPLYDFGDLPDTYSTLDASTGAKHLLDPGLYLGAGVDAETDGVPGASTLGDDSSNSDSYQEPLDDDEDGITFLTPFVAGETALITIEAGVDPAINAGTANAGTAFYGAWIDLNGDGDFDDANEYFTDSITDGTTTLSIPIPAGTVISDTIYSRFRIAADQDEVGQVDDFDDSASSGEVEDYVLMSLGDFVWIDDGAGGGTPDNGIVDGSENTQGVEDVVLQLMDDAGNPVDGDLSTAAIEPITTTTDVNGEYAFTGLISDTYQVKILPDNFVNDGALVGYGSSAPEAPGTDDRDNGIDPATLAAYLIDGVSSDDVDLFNGQAPDAGVDGNGENSDFTVDFGFVPLYDFGDLPDTYSTLDASTGAKHLLDPGLYFGAGVDAETDGMPGASTLGDDSSNSDSYQEPLDDDEDGITFLTPFVAGETALITIEAGIDPAINAGTANAGTAFYGAWIDLNGDGDFDDANEYFTDSITDGTTTLSIPIPAGTVISDTIYSRFRIAADQDEVGQVDDFDAAASSGEVEDYVLMSLGNLVWIDDGAGGGTADNGIVDGNETTQGVEGVVLQLMDDNGNPIDGDLSTAAIEPITTTTDVDGEYAFTGLISDTYQVQVLPDNFVHGGALVGYASSTPETPGTDDRDNGIDPAALADYLTDGVSSADVDLFNGQAPAAVVDGNSENSDFTVDFGFVPLYDFGDLPDTYSTLDASTGANHLLDPGLYFGAGVDAEDDGIPTVDALGDDNSDDNSYQEPLADDEDGIAFMTPIMPGETAVISITAHVDPIINGGTAFYGAWIDLNGDGDFNDADEYFTDSITDGTITLSIPISAGAQISDTIYSRFRIAADQDEVGQVDDFDGDASSGEVEDYVLMSLGNQLWLDDGAGSGTANDGIFDADEAGLVGATVELYKDGDTPGVDTPVATTTTDNDGEYLFTGLLPDDYIVHLPATNFGTGQPLEGLASTTDSGTTGNVDPNNDIDDSADENGIDDPTPSANGITSQPVTLDFGTEPGEAVDGSGVNSNLTVDFGLIYYDLALIKTRSPGQSYAVDFSNNPLVGSYDIVVENQGPTTVAAATVMDTIPDGMTLISVDGVAVSPGVTGTHTLNIANLAAGDSVTFTLVMRVDDLSFGIYTNIAEVSHMEDGNGMSVPDIDSTPDITSTNDAINTTAGIDPNGDDDENSHNALDHQSTDGSAPGSIIQPTTDEDDHDQEVIVGGLAVGNRVWYDTNDNGTIDSGGPNAELGIEDVLVELYKADSNGDITGTLVATDTTDASGYWLIDNLPPGDYIAVIPSSNFAGSEPLVNMYSSTDIGTSGTPNNDTESDDNGTGSTPGPFTGSGGIRSGVISLDAVAGEPEQSGPEDDLGPGHGNAGDEFDNLTVDFGFIQYDLGDLPDSYGTTFTTTANSGPAHVLDGVTFLGAGVDAETDGQPSMDANGDDTLSGIDTADDEDGVTFNTPIMAGEVATITVNASTAGALNVWIDYNGNGTLEAGEQIFTDEMLAAGNNVLTFTAPASVDDDNLYSRFRFTDSAGKVTSPNGSVLTGEVEDYVLMSLGDTVWLDNGAGSTGGSDANNGVQDGTEAAIPGVIVELYAQGTTPGTDAPIATTTTDGNGNYLFTGLVPGDYSVYLPPSNFADGAPLEDHFSSDDPAGLAVDPDDNSDQDDNGAGDGYDDPRNDGIISMPVTLALGSEPTNGTDGDGAQSNRTVDFGLVQYDKGDLPDATVGTSAGDYETLTTQGHDGAMHVIVPDVYLGAGVDSESDGQPHVDAVGDDNGDSDDEDGVVFTSLLLPGQNATVDVDANVDGFLNGWIDFNGDGDFDDPGEQIAADMSLTAGVNNLTFAVPNGTLASDLYTRFRFTSDDPAGALNAMGAWDNGEVEDNVIHLFSLGNQVWHDLDDDGVMDTAEPALDGVVVNLIDPATGAVIMTDTTASGGYYLFDNLLGSGDHLSSSGDYIVEIAASNFSPGGPLEGMYNSTPTEADPDADMDINDNGINPGAVASSQLPATSYQQLAPIQSGIVTLSDYDEPSSETSFGPDGHGNATNDFSNLTVDFGFYLPVTVGDRVWYDHDKDGIQDTPADEPGVPGIDVTLYDSITGQPVLDGNGNPLTMTTDANGDYLFEELPPGRYHVQFDLNDLPQNYIVTAPHVGTNISVDSNANPSLGTTDSTPFLYSNAQDLTLDLGIMLLEDVRVGDRVWYDDNKDGIQDPGETGVAGVQVALYDTATGQPVLDDNGVPIIQATDAGGTYLFDELPPGDYYVQFDLSTLPLNYLVTTDNAGSDDTVDSDGDPTTGVTAPTGMLNSTEQDLTLDLGIYRLDNVRVGDLVWYDDNRDGVQDPSEPGVEDVLVTLYDTATGMPVLDDLGNAVTDVTDTDGEYLFEELPPGDYYVVFDLNTLPQNYTATQQDATNDQSPTTSDQTDSDGDPVTGATAPTGQLNSNEEDLTLDLGIHRLDNVQVGDRVWYDDDKDGVQDAGEDGVPGVSVALYDATTGVPMTDESGSPLTTVTDSDGNYLFEDLPPGDYYVVFDLNTLPPNQTVTQPDIGNDGTDSDVNPATGQTANTGLLNSNEEDLTLDMGIHRLDNVRVGDLVWYDDDRDGIQDPGEAGVANVLAVLYDANTGQPITDQFGVPLIDLTDANGNYLFDHLPPGDYYVGFQLSTLPADYVVTRPNQIDEEEPATSDEVDSDADGSTGVTGWTGPTGYLNANEEDLTLDMGIYLSEGVRVGDKVWLDNDQDGIQDGNEPGVPGVTVSLIDSAGNPVTLDRDGNPITPQVTDGSGYYFFDNLPNGDYAVIFDLNTLPANHAVTQMDQTNDQSPTTSDQVDSDGDPTTGETPSTGPLVDGDEDLTLDLGIYPTSEVRVGDIVWYDNDGDGIQDIDEPGVEGVLVSLFNADGTAATDMIGNPVGPKATDANGRYLFENLPAGDYYVVFDLATLPNGYQPTTQDATDDQSPATSDQSDSDGDPTTGQTASTGLLELGEEDLTLDLGIVAPVRIGDRVWYDHDRDGQQDAPADEPGVPDVTVNIFHADGTAVTTDMDGNPVVAQVTNADGNYLFENLAPGDYYVQFDLATLPADSIVTLQDTTNDQQPTTSDQTDSDGDPATGVTATTGFLTANTEDLTLDLGIYQPEDVQVGDVQVGDRVWYDNDQDGIQDADESGVAGVTVRLFNADGTPVTDKDGNPVGPEVTDSSGNYLFDNLPEGDYYAVFDLTTLPNGYQPTVQDATNDQSPTTSDQQDSDANPGTGQTADTGFLTSGTADLTLDMGIYQEGPTTAPIEEPVQVGNRVWYDNDGDGLQDDPVDEPGVAGVTVTLFDGNGNPVTDLAGQPVGPEVTDNDGFYLFDNLPEGDYYVVFGLDTLPTDYVVTHANVVDAEQPGVSDALDSDGNRNTGRTPTTDELMGGEEDMTLDLGIVKPVSVGNRVWVDEDGDGLQDDPNEEPGVEGVTVMIFNADGTPVTDMDGKLVGEEVTDGNGGYLFDNLPPGSYYVQFDLDTLPGSYTVTTAESGDDDTADSDVNPETGKTAETGFLPSGNQDLTLDMGIVSLGEVKVGDRVWYDDDKDGLQDPGESGVEGVTVRLFNADGTPVIDSDGNLVGPETTNSDGNYLFDNLPPGDYYVQFDGATLPASYTVTVPNQGSDDGIDSDVSNAPNVVLQSGNTGFLPANSQDLTLDMGIVQTEPVSIGNLVWIDTNDDGIQGDPADEPGVAGVTVVLFNGDGTPVTDIDGNPVGPEITDSNGNYLFENLPPGEYYVDFDLTTIPDGYGVTEPNATNDQQPATSDQLDSDANPGSGTTGTVLVTSGENLTLDMGLVELEGVRVGDRVWLDKDRDGIQDDGEAGIPGVVVTLYEALGTDPLATTVTDSDGNYLFDELPPGNYFVIFDLDTLPIHHVVTTQNSGSNDGLDSDATTDEGRSDTTGILFDGEEDLTLDMGVYPLGNVEVGDRVWYDHDQNGIQDEGETGVENVSVTLYDATTGELLTTTTTDSLGNYLFQDLPPGDYYVVFELDTLPMGYVPTIQNATNNQSPATSDQSDSDADPVTGQTDKTNVLFDGEEDLSLDMGIYRLPGVEVGKTVWFDDDGDGVQDVSEKGVPGVTVYLIDTTTGEPVLDDQGNPMSDVTDSQGEYLFTELPPGQYHVVFDLETIPDDYVVTQPVQIVGGSVADPTTGETPPTNVLINSQRDHTLNMGIWKPVQVGNVVWHDENGNGIQDDEPGVAGVTVTLYNSTTNAPVTDENGNPLTLVTDEAGHYLFENLPPGDYYVGFDLETLPDGYIVTHQDTSSEDSLDSDVDSTTAQTPATGLIPSGEQDLTQDMGIVRPVSVGNFVWLDSDSDGVQDADEEGVPGISVTLYDTVTGEPVTDDQGNPLTDVTDGSGSYSFTELLPGDYYVIFDLDTLPADHVITRPNVTNDQSPATSDQEDSDVNPGTGQSSSTGFLTDGEANDTLDMGIYSVVELVGESPDEENPEEENPNEENPEEENPNEETEEVPAETAIRVGGTLWVEENPNGQVDEGELVLSGVTVILYNVAHPDTPIATQVTDEDGYYLFDNLPEGEYYTMLVTSTLPEGAILPPSLLNDEGLLRTTTGPLTDNGEFLSMDIPILFTGSLSGQVWLDQNGNGVRTDEVDTILAEIPVRIYDEYGDLVAETVTDEMGNYSFPDLMPGLYQVEYVKPENHGVSPDETGERPELTEGSEPETLMTETILVGSQDEIKDVDLGLYPGASIGNLVWEDLDGDGLLDEDETGLSNLVVQLIDEAGTVIAETTTDEDGFYGFTELLPGDYAVVVFRPDDLVPGLQNELPLDSESDPTSVQTALFPVAPGESYTNVDVNFVQPSAIGNFVWLDTDKDGIYDDNEIGFPGVTIYLYDTQGNVVAQTQTDGEGRFEFIVPPGEYQIKFDIPAGMELTIENGGDDTVDSDVDSETGMTPFTVLTPGETDHTFYAGLIVSPTAIQLMSLVATDSAHGVAIHWSTGAEFSTFGFLIYRSRDGRFENAIQVTDSMVLSGGDDARYHFVDTTAHSDQVYSYWLVEVQNDGQTYQYGPSQVITGQPFFLLYLPIMEQ